MYDMYDDSGTMRDLGLAFHSCFASKLAQPDN